MIPLYLELIRFLKLVFKQLESYLPSPAHHNFIFFCHCLHLWERHSWECSVTKAWKYLTRDNSTFREWAHFELVVLLSDSFTVWFQSMGVVQSTKCSVLKWETPSILPFSQTYLCEYFESVILRYPLRVLKWNCFRKTGLNTRLIVSLVRTATSLTKMISRKYKLHVLKRKMLISLSHQNLFLARSNAKTHSFFLRVVMFNLTIFWVRENRTRKPC